MDHAYSNIQIKEKNREQAHNQHLALQDKIKASHELQNVLDYRQRLMKKGENKELARY